MNRILSPDYYLGAIFHNPKASLWPQVRAILEESADFVESFPDGTVMAGFTKDPAQVKAAVKVFHIAQGWKKTASFFLRGKPLLNLYDHKWYRCYLDALQCDTAVPYCREEREVLDADGESISGALVVYMKAEIEVPEGFPFDEERVKEEGAEHGFEVNSKPGLKCVVPCSQVFFGWQRGTPGTIISQFWAKAVKYGYANCPLFNIDNFQVEGEAGTRKFTLLGAPAAAR